MEGLLERLKTYFPSSWRLRVVHQQPRAEDIELDALLEVTATDGTSQAVAVEVKRQPALNAVGFLKRLQSAGYIPLLLAPYLSPILRERLKQEGLSYADATGNLRLVLERPATYLELQGATKNPWPETRSLHSLKGPAAGRVIRALCDFRPPYRFRDLKERAQLAMGSLSRVVSVLTQENLVERDPKGSIIEVYWKQLLYRWTQDYRVLDSNQMATYLAPRGLESFLKRLQASGHRYCLTGSFVATARAPVAPSRLAMVYLERSEGVAKELGLLPTEQGANVMVLKGFDPVVFDRSWQHEGYYCTALSQAAADLLTSPGRGPAEAEALIEWMESHEDAWRY